MSLSQDLLRQYNKRKIDTPADTNTMGMARSYANPYDMLYEQFKDDKNFNVNTWQQSLKEGNEDTYLTFLERNKDQNLSDSFYDPSYYGYETQMLELSRAFADNTTKKKETLTTWDPRKNAWVENEVEMTEIELIDYQLNQAREQRTADVTKQIEQYRKDLMSTTSKVLHSGATTLAELGEGAASGVAGIIDFVVAIPAATMGAAGGKNWLDAYVEYIGSQGLTALEQETLRAALDEYERTHTFFKDIDGNTTTAGMYFTGVANSVGRMIPAIAINYLTGGLASTVGFSFGTPAFYAGVYINNVYENVNKPATANSPALMQVVNAAIKAAAEAVIEYALGEMLGGTIQNRMLGMQGKASFTAGFGKMSGVKYLAKSALQEGLEEFLQDFSTNLVDQFTGMWYEGYEHTGVTFKTLVDSFTVGVISSLVMSGGAIARNAASSKYSDIQANRAQSFLSRAETEVENSERLTQKAQKAAESSMRAATPVVEGENGELVKVKGAKRLAWSAMMSDINQALRDLKDGKGDLELSQEVYAAVTTLAEFYSSFDTTELKNVEILLQRVAKAEQTVKIPKSNLVTVTGDSFNKTVKTKQQAEIEYKAAVKAVGEKLYTEITTMIGEVSLRANERRIKEAIEKVSEKLVENDVTEVKSTVDRDGEFYGNDELKKIDEKLHNKILSMSSEYDFIFTTDGHVAVEEDGMLFVPESWLENYTKSEIYRFLEQNEILENILTNKELDGMIKAIVKHNLQFTKQESVTHERALMDFLFNKSVYQHFLLSQNAKNLFEFKEFVTRMHDLIKIMALNKNLSAERKAELNKVYEQIKQTHREPTIKAIINWNINPQLIGADSILTEADRRMINQYQVLKNQKANAAKGGPLAGDHKRTIEVLRRDGGFNKSQNAILDRGLADNATLMDRLYAVGLLNSADRRYKSSFDFIVQESINNNAQMALAEVFNTEDGISVFLDLAEDTFSAVSDDTYANILSLIKTIREADDRLSLIGENFEVFDEALNRRSREIELLKKGSLSTGALNIPMGAFSGAFDSKAETQFKIDVLNKFENDFGITASQIYSGDLRGMTAEQRSRLEQEMESLKTTELSDFVTRKLEKELGNDWTVTPLYRIDKGITNVNPETGEISYDTVDAYKDLERIETLLVSLRGNIIKADHIRTIENALISISQLTKEKTLVNYVKNITEMQEKRTPYEIFKYFERTIEKALKPSVDLMAQHIDLDVKAREENKTPRVIDFQIVRAIPAEQLLKDSLIEQDDNLDPNTTFLDAFERVLGQSEFVPKKLGELLRFEPKDPVGKRIANWTVTIIDDNKDSLGKTSYENTEIRINIAHEQDLLDTLVHEINHVLQYEYNLTRGFSPTAVLQMPEFQEYILKNFPEIIAYSLSKTGYHKEATLIRSDGSSSLLKHNIIRARTAFIAYTLVQGEIWAEHYMHNGKLVKAFTMQQAPNGDSYIVSPDGKEKFRIPHTQTLSPMREFLGEHKKEAPMTKTEATNAAQRTFNNILGVRQEGDTSEDVRDTYHAKLSRMSSIELTENILNSGLSVTTRAKATINDIITNPAAFLSQEMIDLMKQQGRELTEGDAYHFLKDYFEQNFDGVSIERDGITHEYLFVDDNAFDDLLRIDTYNARNDKNKDLVKNTTLDGIYKSLELSRLGIPTDIPVIVSEDGVTQAVFNEQHPNGAILIRTNSDMTNEKFINIVNHEFRHIVQRYSNFEGGFTTDFKVTSEMLADMKKHVPEIFKDKNLREAAEKAGLNPDVFIAQQFVYYLTGGEINAYGIKSYLLNLKPVFVEVKGGQVAIHMPWYNSKTGEGRYNTEFLAGRHDDGVKIELPRVKKKGQAKRETIRKDEAKDTNLKYFVEKGVQKQMPADLKKFIIATTSNEDKLPAEIVHAIKKGKFTKQALFKWFRMVDTKDINQFTFDLINKTMFKNNVITDMKTLDQLVSSDVTMWWAASILFKREGLLDTTLLVENDAQKFIDFITSLENTEWKKKMFKIMETFDYYLVQNKKGETVRAEIGMDQATADYMRVLAMQYFDGTLAGAFYTANTLRNVVREHQGRKHDREVGLAALTTKGTGKGKKARDTTFVGSSEIDAAGNDLLAIYNIDIMYKQEEDMITELGLWYKEKLEQEGLDLKEQMSKMLEFVTELKELGTDDIRARFVEMQNELLTGVESGTDIRDTSQDLGEPIRTNIVANLKSLGTRITNAVRDGKVVWANLPKEVRDMFELKTYTRDRKKVEFYELKPEVYSVGRGTVEGSTAFNYKRHDMTQIIANRDLLRQVLTDINNNVFTNKEATKEIDKLRKRLDAKTRQQIRQGEEISRLKGEVRETAFRVDKRNRASDTPQHFTLVSNMDMPEVLRKLFDTGFTQMADTLVQFASKDEDGNLYDKSNSEFESRLKHEVNTWDAFYEANIDTLSQLTRTDVLDIVEFIQGGVATIQGPTNKLAAFQIFTLGYIIDGARRNFNNWNFSDAEKNLIETVYERKASEYGSGINAVGQMIKVINPFKKVQQRMLENYNITSAELEPLLKAAEKLQKATALKDRQEAGKDVATQLRILENLMRERNINPKTGQPMERGFGKRWYQKLKSWRFMSMLSRPTTWVRNLTSNVSVHTLNNSADFLGSFVFGVLGKKAYRQDQWNLRGTKIDPKVKAFIDENIKTSELFNLLYDGSTKYDDRKKSTKDQKELFVTMIVEALEHKYAAENRFDSKTMNRVAGFVNKMISDKPFIKLAATRYLGKLLTLQKADLSKGLDNNILNSFAEAVILASEDYMHKRSFAADMIDSLKEKHPVAYEVMTFFQPFLNSSFNWFAESLKYNPIALTKAIFNATKLEERIAKLDARRAKGEIVTSSRAAEAMIRRDIGKGIIGTLLLGLGMMLSLTGIIRIDDEDDAFYVIMGDVKIDITSIFGSSSILVGASLAQVGSSDIDDVMKYVATYFFEGFAIKDLLDQHRYDENFWEVLMTQMEGGLKSYTPQFVQLFVMALNNEKIRYSPGMKGAWERWLNSWVLAQPFGNRRINPYTGEVETKYSLPFFGNLLAAGILGPKMFITEMSEIEAFARESGVSKTELTGDLTVNGTKHQLDRETLNKKYGEMNKKSLAQITQQSHYVQMPDGTYKTLSWSKMSEAQRKNVIDRTMRENADLAKIYVWTQVMSKKYYGSEDLLKKLKSVGVTKNVYRGDKGFV